jgi:hypothetical protein
VEPTSKCSGSLSASFLAWAMERLSLNMALNPCPFAPGPMNRNVPFPALNELWLQAVPLATVGNVRAFSESDRWDLTPWPWISPFARSG